MKASDVPPVRNSIVIPADDKAVTQFGPPPAINGLGEDGIDLPPDDFGEDENVQEVEVA